MEIIVKRHGNSYYEWILIWWFRKALDDLNDRYYMEDNLKEWDSFFWDDVIKIWWLQVHCQKFEEEIIKLAESDLFLLLQIWFWDWVQSVFIDKNELKKKNFSNCIFEWWQS